MSADLKILETEDIKIENFRLVIHGLEELKHSPDQI